MEIGKRKPSGREKDEASLRLLEKLQDQLHSQHASGRRQAAFNLSWMQEDGLDILKKALFGDFPITTKNAAAYGLRKMRGRMKKIALEVLREGIEHTNSNTREVCRTALLRLEGKLEQKPVSKGRANKSRFEIKDIRRTGKLQRTVGMIHKGRQRPLENKRSDSRD